MTSTDVIANSYHDTFVVVSLKTSTVTFDIGTIRGTIKTKTRTRRRPMTTVKQTSRWLHRRYRHNSQDARSLLSWNISESQVDQPVIGRTPFFISRCTGTVITIITTIIVVVIVIVITITFIVSGAHRAPRIDNDESARTWQDDRLITRSLRTYTHSRTEDWCPRSFLTSDEGSRRRTSPGDGNGAASHNTHTRIRAQGLLFGVEIRATSRRRPTTAPRAVRRRDAWRNFETTMPSVVDD